MKLRYLLKKTINIKTSYLIAIMIVALLIIVGCFSYAIFTVSSESRGALNIVTGNLYPYIESIDLDANKSIVLQPNEERIITLNLKNINNIDVKTNLYYTSTSDNIEIGYLKQGDAAPTNIGYVLGKHGDTTDTKKIYVKIINNDQTTTTVTFGSNVGLSTVDLAFPSDQTKKILSLIEGNVYNNNIVAAYLYNETSTDSNYCITGSEQTCQTTTCYQNNSENSCLPNTIINYKVNENITKIFYVIKDTGNKMVLQSQDNTASNVKWYEIDDISRGPVTALSALEEATKDWINVNEQDYSIGTSDSTLGYSGCETVSSCQLTTYTLKKESVRARMIIPQEAIDLGCKYNVENSCPLWMYNALDNTTNNYGYWTMASVPTNVSLNQAYNIFSYGSITNHSIFDVSMGVRAVVEIKKN